MNYKIFYDYIKQRMGVPNDEKPEVIAETISKAYNMACMGHAVTWYQSTFLKGDVKKIENAIIDAYATMADSKKDIMIGWQRIALGFSQFWQSAEFTPIPPCIPATGPAPGNKTGTVVLFSVIKELPVGLQQSFKIKEFDMFVRNLYNVLVKYHRTISGNYFGVTTTPPGPIMLYWKGIFAAESSYDNFDKLKVYPEGGWGLKVKVIIDFENKYREAPEEHIILTDKFGNKPLYNIGTTAHVPPPIDWETFVDEYENRIFVHSHPTLRFNTIIENETDEYIDEIIYFGAGEGGSFSGGDIAIFVTNAYPLEMRVAAPNYTYVMQEPKIGWKKWKRKYANELYKFEYEDINSLLYDEIRSEKEYFLAATYSSIPTNIMSIFEKTRIIRDETLHLTNLEISKRYEIPYGRYPVSSYKPRGIPPNNILRRRVFKKDIAKEDE